MVAAANVANTYVVPTATKVSPFYDDFDEAKNFYRILFRPGYSIQARELTQLQTILQNQVERFGRHVFENGSPVIGGTINIPEYGFDSILLQREQNNFPIVAANYKNTTLVLRGAYDPVSETYADDDSVVFRVNASTEGTELDLPSVYGSYATTGRFEPGAVVKVLGEQTFATLHTEAFDQPSLLAFIRDSVFFYNGFFVKVPAQATVIGKYTTKPFCRVGLQFDEQIVSENTDTTLLDPALESTNYQAPGAARYKMDLILSFRALDSIDDVRFIELARVEDGVLKSQTRFPVYSEIEEVMARRTYDESGNYTVRPFKVQMIRDRFDPVANVTAKLSPGKGYIQGYEFETISDTEVHVPRGRDRISVANLDFNLNYGNYVVVDNMFGHFDVSNVAMFDIHCVPSQFVDTSSNTNYQKTKIGTGRSNYFQFYGGNTANVWQTQYEFYLFDTKFSSIQSNANVVSSNTITLYNSSTLLTSNINSYTGATLRIVSGPGAGDSYNIQSYTAATQTFQISPTTFTTNPTAASNVSIEFDFKEAESFYIHKSWTPGGTNYSSNTFTNITALNKSANDPLDAAQISEPKLGTLLFKLPENYVSANIDYSSYVYTKKFDKEFVNGTLSFPLSANTNEDFQGSTTTSNTSLTSLDNFFVVCTNKKSTTRANGDIVRVTATVPGDGTAQLTSGGSGDTFSATVYAKVEIKTPAPPKKKIFVEANTRTFSEETGVTLTGWSTGSTANVFANAAQVLITNPSREIGVAESLYISDTLGVLKIYDLNGATPTAGEDLTSYTDVTNRFSFDNGQRDTHYDHASIRLKPNYPSCQGPLLVCAYYWKHQPQERGSNYFSVDSYFTDNQNAMVTTDGLELGDGYSIIPPIRRNDGSVVELRDCIDFRPSRKNASNASPNYEWTDVGAPMPAGDMNISYAYYLGRKDLIVLNPNRKIELVRGDPAKVPIEPTPPSRSMVLYSLNIPPYTKFPTDVKIKYVDNKRYTMRDIGKIDKRVENLEYYVSLNTLEKKALDMSITDVFGLERTKYGVFADSFTGHALGNPSLEDYRCAMEFNEGFMTCQSNLSNFFIRVDPDQSTDIKITRDKVILDYSETPLITQETATKFSAVAEFAYGVFDGNIVTIPESDIWHDVIKQPDIIVTDQAFTEINNDYYNYYTTNQYIQQVQETYVNQSTYINQTNITSIQQNNLTAIQQNFVDVEYNVFNNNFYGSNYGCPVRPVGCPAQPPMPCTPISRSPDPRSVPSVPKAVNTPRATTSPTRRR